MPLPAAVVKTAIVRSWQMQAWERSRERWLASLAVAIVTAQLVDYISFQRGPLRVWNGGNSVLVYSV